MRIVSACSGRTMIRISRIQRIGIVIQHQQSVSIRLMCGILDGVCLLNGSYRFFIRR